MAYTPEFIAFWKLYPSRWNSNLHTYVKRKKYPAFQSWQKLDKATQAECLYKAKWIKQTEGTPRDCVTWLNQRGWDDIDMEVPEPVAEIVKTIKFKQVPDGKVDVNDAQIKNRKGLGL